MGPLILLAQVSAQPSAEGLPGAEFIQTLLDWLAQIALWGAVGSMLLGGALAGYSNWHGNSYGVSQGMRIAGGGFVGAVLAALAATIVNALFSAASGTPPSV